MAKQNKYNSFIEDGVRCMECRSCGYYVEGIGMNAASVMCDRCLMSVSYTHLTLPTTPYV